MRSDDAVESFKCHKYNKHSATKGARAHGEGDYTAVPVLIGRHVHVQHCVQVPGPG